MGGCDRYWPNPQLGEGHRTSCSMRTSADCLHLVGHTLQLVGAIKKEQEVDPPAVRVVPTELFSMACYECKQLPLSEGDWTDDQKRCTVGY